MDEQDETVKEVDIANLPSGMPPDEPADLFEWLWRTREYEAEIFIRAYRSKHWVNVSLKESTPQEWAAFMSRALQTGILPVRVKRPSEIKEEG